MIQTLPRRLREALDDPHVPGVQRAIAPKLWQMWGDKPHIRQMAEIVERTVEVYILDFYYHDLLFLSRCQARSYAWVPYACGTHMVALQASSAAEAVSVTRTLAHLARENPPRAPHIVDTVRQMLRRTTWQEVMRSVRVE
jgi:hypothetical protein